MQIKCPRPPDNLPYFFVIAFALLLSGMAIAAAEQAADFPSSRDSIQKTGAADQVDTEHPSSIFSQLKISGYLKNETAFRFDEPRSFTKIRNILYLKTEYPMGSWGGFTFAGWAYHDLVYDLFDYQTISGRSVRNDDQPLVFVDNLKQKKDSPVAAIRELYLDVFTDKMDIRIGKQYVVWGVLEGIRITDEINPLDFRELILPDLLDYRIPLWTFKADYFGDMNTYEFLWIPELKFHKPAPRGSEWELLQRVPGIEEPDSYELRNSEIGLKATGNYFDTEISLSYFWTWDDFPVIFRSARIDNLQNPDFFPTYTRIHMYGATFTKQLGASILKGEIAYVTDKYFGLQNDVDKNNDGFLDSQGELKKNHIRWGLGLDFNWLGTDWSPAISQWIILDYEKGLIQDEYDTSLTLFARTPLPAQSAVFELLVIGLVNLRELYINPELSFDITDHFQIATGLDLFYGDRSQLGVSASGGAIANLNTVEQNAQFFGNFNDNDRIYAEFKYTF